MLIDMPSNFDPHTSLNNTLKFIAPGLKGPKIR